MVDIQTYLDDWTHPLPDISSEVWKMRVELEKLMHEKRMDVYDKKPDLDDADRELKKDSGYRAYMRLRTRLNLLLRYYGYDGGRRRDSAIDFLPSIYRILRSFDELEEDEKLLLEWAEMFLVEKGISIDGGWPPKPKGTQKYSEIRAEVLDKFTGDQTTDLASWDDAPEYWVAQDEWHTERIRCQRLERQQQRRGDEEEKESEEEDLDFD